MRHWITAVQFFIDPFAPLISFDLHRSAKEWNQIANNVKPTGNYLLLDLEPANWYHLRVTAHNNAGFAVAEYEFATLSVDGST